MIFDFCTYSIYIGSGSKSGSGFAEAKSSGSGSTTLMFGTGGRAVTGRGPSGHVHSRDTHEPSWLRHGWRQVRGNTFEFLGSAWILQKQGDIVFGLCIIFCQKF